MPDVEGWQNFFLMIGTSAGALVGLLFIVISLHFDKISERADATMRMTVQGSRYNTLYLLIVLVEAAVMLTPQPAVAVGLELIGLNLLGLRLPLIIVHRYAGQGITLSERGGFPTREIAMLFAFYVMGAAGGVGVAMGFGWGVFVVAVACVAKLVRTVQNAWMLTFGLFPTEAA